MFVLCALTCFATPQNKWYCIEIYRGDVRKEKAKMWGQSPYFLVEAVARQSPLYLRLEIFYNPWKDLEQSFCCPIYSHQFYPHDQCKCWKLINHANLSPLLLFKTLNSHKLFFLFLFLWAQAASCIPNWLEMPWKLADSTSHPLYQSRANLWVLISFL